MANLKAADKRKLEKLLRMESGYVLDFSNRTFADFFSDYKINIEEEKYCKNGLSKANRMRTFWDISSNNLVGQVINGLIDYVMEENCEDNNSKLLDDCQKIAKQLLSPQQVVEVDALTVIADKCKGRDFELLVENIRESIGKDKPEAILDHLHTLVHKFMRVICEPYGIVIDRNKPLHSILGEYIKKLCEGNYLESEMAKRILKCNISVLEAFNKVRNDKSFAHDNKLLNYEESLLICNHVAAFVRFINSVEKIIQTDTMKRKQEEILIDELPF
ncbi:abortive infection family protein [Bartonella sp. B30(2025)]